MRLITFVIGILLVLSFCSQLSTAQKENDKLCRFVPPSYKCHHPYTCKPNYLSQTGHTDGPPPGWRPPPGTSPPPGWPEFLPWENYEQLDTGATTFDTPVLSCSVLKNAEEKAWCEDLVQVSSTPCSYRGVWECFWKVSTERRMLTSRQVFDVNSSLTSTFSDLETSESKERSTSNKADDCCVFTFERASWINVIHRRWQEALASRNSCDYGHFPIFRELEEWFCCFKSIADTCPGVTKFGANSKVYFPPGCVKRA